MHWLDENDSVCCSRDTWIDVYYTPCYMKIVVEFSKDLHDFNTDFCLKITMKFYTFGCFFYHYSYIIHCWGGFLVKADRYQKDNVEQTFTFCNQDFYVQVCYTCFFSLLKVKKYDVKHVNDILKKVCLFYLSDSTISRYHGYAKTRFEMLQIYLRTDKCEPNKAMTICCFRCLKIIACYILSDLYCV